MTYLRASTRVNSCSGFGHTPAGQAALVKEREGIRARAEES